MIGLIGRKFADEEAKSQELIANSNETIPRDYAEWTITTLVTFKDNIEEFDNAYAYNCYLNPIMKEIEEINRVLKKKDEKVAKDIDLDDDFIIRVIRKSRLIRGPFSIDQLIDEFEEPVDKKRIKKVCDQLVENSVAIRKDGAYSIQHRELEY